MPGGTVYAHLSKSDRDRNVKQMNELVRTLKAMNTQVAKLVKLTEQVARQLGAK